MDNTFNFLQSSFFNTSNSRKYEINELRVEREINSSKESENIFNHTKEPLLSIGIKFFRESKYNKIATESINININTDTNLRFFGL